MLQRMADKESMTEYKVLMSDAMSSAMQSEDSKEIINEFLRIVGEATDADRISVYENAKEREVIHNTYEWCRNGVAKRGGQRKNLPMSAFTKWYADMEREDAILVLNPKELAQEYPEAGNLINSINGELYAVGRMTENDKISGFVVVENLKQDSAKTKALLELVASFMVSLIRMRNQFIKAANKARMTSYAALGEIYYSMHYIDIRSGAFQEIKSNKRIQDTYDERIGVFFPDQIALTFEKLVHPDHLEELLKFVDITTLQERLQNERTIAHEFLGLDEGWCRARFIKVEEDSKGNLASVLFVVIVIDEEKKRENHLRYLSERDLMTGILNRGIGEKKIAELVDNSVGGLLCLLDCDRFKNINDTYGHAVGDRVLISIADALKKSCRDNDIVMRLGGDEFALYAINVSTRQQAERVINRIFDSIRMVKIPELGENQFTISLGATLCLEDEKTSFDELYKEADKAMYESKKSSGYAATFYE